MAGWDSYPKRRAVQASGTLGAAVQPTVPRRVYDGDSPSPFRTVWLNVAAAAQEVLDQARTDPVGARRFLALVTMGSRSREVHEREIAFLQRHGVPAGFLPDADELDRLFPVATAEEPVSRSRPLGAGSYRPSRG